MAKPIPATANTIPATRNAKIDDLVGMSFHRQQWAAEESRGVVVSRLNPDHYLVRYQDEQPTEVQSFRIITLDNMKNWRFFATDAESKQWDEAHAAELRRIAEESSHEDSEDELSF